MFTYTDFHCWLQGFWSRENSLTSRIVNPCSQEVVKEKSRILDVINFLLTSCCPPDYSVTDKTAPHKFLFWPRDRVNHQGDLWGWPWSSGFGSNILVMALFRVQGWHRLDGCPVLHLMVSLECPYFLVVLGNISKLCWLHLVFDESLSTLAIDQNRHRAFHPGNNIPWRCVLLQIHSTDCSIFLKYIKIFFGWLNIPR